MQGCVRIPQKPQRTFVCFPVSLLGACSDCCRLDTSACRLVNDTPGRELTTGPYACAASSSFICIEVRSACKTTLPFFFGSQSFFGLKSTIWLDRMFPCFLFGVIVRGIVVRRFAEAEIMAVAIQSRPLHFIRAVGNGSNLEVHAQERIQKERTEKGEEGREKGEGKDPEGRGGRGARPSLRGGDWGGPAELLRLRLAIQVYQVPVSLSSPAAPPPLSLSSLTSLLSPCRSQESVPPPLSLMPLAAGRSCSTGAGRCCPGGNRPQETIKSLACPKKGRAHCQAEAAATWPVD